MTNSPCLPVDLRTEYLENPLGIEEGHPRLSWRLDDERKGTRQTARRIIAASSPERLDAKPDLWDSGIIKSDQSLDIIYGGRALKSRARVFWRAQVWDHERNPSAWSNTAFFEMGLLRKTDWKASWIGRPLEGHEGSQPAPFLRREFNLKSGLSHARVYVTARGLFELRINGQRVGEDYFTPGWTDFNKRLPYRVYDVKEYLQPGANAIGAILGDGWYAGYLAWRNNRNLYGDQLSLCAQIEFEYFDGTSEKLITDSSWKTAFGPIIASDIYHGETYDARREIPGWDAAGFDDAAWAASSEFSPPKAIISACRNYPVRRQEEIHPIAQTEPRFGVHVFDLGQNMVGWARIKARGSEGQRITIRYAEMLNSDGTLYTANLRSARCIDHYICRGGAEEVFEPRFTFHGFRYIELTGLSEKPSLQDVTGIVLHSEIPSTGFFSCSDDLINRLQSNILWGQKGNFLEVPTDCPQRDERLGWTGDAQVFIPTAAFNRDVAAFFTKWCIDLEDAQFKDGAFTHVAPNVLGNGRGAAAWADAGVICPWTIYRAYGDCAILARHYTAMLRWVEWRRKNSKNLICSSACFGDWLAIIPPGGNSTPRDLIATAYFARTTDIVAKIASRLGKKADAKKYAALARQVKDAFNREFVSTNGRIMGDSQTAYLLALGFDLLPTAKQAYALERLVTDLERNDWHLSTGFVGTPLLAPVLSRFGRTDIAYRLLLQKTYPSWLCPIIEGDATTMWERWNSFTKKDGFGNADMNSFNHYAYGAIGEWLYETVAGISPDTNAPGYKHSIIRPQPGEGLAWARGKLLTRYGVLACEWKIKKGRFSANVIIPPNTTATIILPGLKTQKVAAGMYSFVTVMPREKKQKQRKSK